MKEVRLNDKFWFGKHKGARVSDVIKKDPTWLNKILKENKIKLDDKSKIYYEERCGIRKRYSFELRDPVEPIYIDPRGGAPRLDVMPDPPRQGVVEQDGFHNRPERPAPPRAAMRRAETPLDNFQRETLRVSITNLFTTIFEIHPIPDEVRDDLVGRFVRKFQGVNDDAFPERGFCKLALNAVTRNNMVDPRSIKLELRSAAGDALIAVFDL